MPPLFRYFADDDIDSSRFHAAGYAMPPMPPFAAIIADAACRHALFRR